jgi:predicted nucleotidyltransferase
VIDDAALGALVARLVAHEDPDSVYVFGSQADGRAHARSDLDLLVVKETALPRYRRGRNAHALLARDGRAIDVLVYTPGELAEAAAQPHSFEWGIMRTARLVYQRGERA